MISRRPARSATPVAISKSGLLGRAARVCGPVVVIVRVVLPLVTSDDGFAEQVASFIVVGTTQLNVTVPVNPVSGLIVIVEDPLCPGAVIVMLVGFDDNSKPGMTVIVRGAEVEPA